MRLPDWVAILVLIAAASFILAGVALMASGIWKALWGRAAVPSRESRDTA